MFPLTIKYRDIDESEALSASVWEYAEKLEHLFDRIVSCQVTISRPHNHRRRGGIYHVQVYLHIPGAEIVVNREHELNPEHKDAYIAVKDAFLAAGRMLEEKVSRRREDRPRRTKKMNQKVKQTDEEVEEQVEESEVSNY